MPNTQERTSKFHFGRCHLCENKLLVRWIQRGVTHPEWIRACSNCENISWKNNRRNRRHRNQLDLFATEK